MNSAKNQLLSLAVASLGSHLVSIDGTALREIKIPKQQLSPMDCDLPVPLNFEEKVRGVSRILAMNAINYMFWSLRSVNAKKTVSRYSFEGIAGFNGMQTAFDRAWNAGVFEAPKGPITVEFVSEHFGDLPDLESRAALLTEMFQGDRLAELAKELVLRVERNKVVTVADALTIKAAFPLAYSDIFLKRSQLALMEIAVFLSVPGGAVDSSDLTVCADYQLPKVLRGLGLIRYSEELSGQVDNLHLIEAGSAYELAIRAATLWVCEEWARVQGCSTAAIDNFLWLNRNTFNAPFHLTYTTDY